MLYGFDIGGTKIEFSVYDQQLNLQFNKRVPTPTSDYQALLHAINEMVLEADTQFACRGMVGVGFPGAINTRNNTLIIANLPSANGKPLQADLEAVIDRQVVVQNDANCFLISECYGGAADNANTVLGVTLGTGVGGAVFVNGDIHSGHNFFAGEIGHFPLPATMLLKYPELPYFTCGCGRKACLETYVSGTGLGNLYQHFAKQPLKGPEILEKYMAGDKTAAKVVNVYLDILAAGLGMAMSVLDPDAIVFGGGLAGFEEIYTELPKRLPDHLLPNVALPTLKKAEFGGAGGVRGAALLNYRR